MNLVKDANLMKVCSKGWGLINGRRGVVGITAALLMAPPALMTVGNLHYGRELANLTRVQQASDAAVLQFLQQAVYSTESGEAATRTLLNENMRVLERSARIGTVSPILSNGAESASAQLEVSYSTLSPITFQPGNPHPSTLGSVQVKSSAAELFYRPLEIVISLDASSSQESNTVKEMVSKAMENTFGTSLQSGEVRVSLVAYSGNVNLGTEYADALIKKDSRKLTAAGSPIAGGTYWVVPGIKSQAVYDAQEATLDAINPVLKDDLLAEGGPGQDWNFAPVARKPIPDEDDQAVMDYVSELDYPPLDEEDKFDLLVADGRLIEEGEGSYASTKNDSPWSGSFLYTYDYFAGGQMKDAHARQLAAIPEEWYQIDDHDSQSLSLSQFVSWTFDSVITGKAGSPYTGMKYSDAIVSFYPNAPKMRILAGSSSAAEVNDRMQDYGAVFTTGIDEAFTWSYRLSSPNWSGVWNRGDDFPAPYFGRTKKVMLMYLGHATTGYSVGSWSSEASIIPQVCRRFAENGVTLKMLMPAEEYADDEEVEELTECAAYGKALGSEFVELSQTEIEALFAELAVRPGKFRNTLPM